MNTNINITDITELCQTRDQCLRSLKLLDDRIEKLKELVDDEENKKKIILSDEEFDNGLVDPRYELDTYRSTHLKREKSPSLSGKKGNVPGLIKNSENFMSMEIIKRDEIQRKRAEKQLLSDLTRNEALKSFDELPSLLTTINKAHQLNKEQEKLERERREEMKRAPVISGFEPFEDPSFFQVVESNKIISGENYNLESDPGFDSFSHMYIKARYVPEEFLKTQLRGTIIIRLSKLYQMIPGRITEMMETNTVVTGVIKKRFKPSLTERGQKYVKILLSDFKFDIVVFLWGDAYERFWKIRQGSICAILNPEIKPMPTRHGHSKTYMLRVESGLSIIEYAKFAHFGICRGLKGQPCSEAVDSRKSNYCPYHLEKSADKNASNRNEMGSNYKLFTPVDREGNKQVLMLKESDLERLELESEAKEAKKNSYNSLAISNIKPNPSIMKANHGVMITDLSNPDTQANLRSKEEIHANQFKSHEAYVSFLDKGLNKAKLHEQEKRHELDLRLKKEMIERDENLKRKYDKEVQILTYKKLKQQEFKERKKELLIASRTKKSLRKNKVLINKIHAEHAEVDKSIEMRKQHERSNRNDMFDRDVQLSSDDDSEFELE